MNFADEVINWYSTNKRDLPWRNSNDAYVIWLSEIILQQTRVEQGLPYFNRFLEKYPDVKHFAAADESEILKLWQGLGYYSRGRNMLKTARMVNELFQGNFPDRYEQLIKLKGIGEYTAAAISSFAANEAKAVVDGNVYRVLARYFGIDEDINSTKGKKTFQQLANDLLNKETPGLHNQAMMEFGAMLCKPKNPDCKACPLAEGCFARKNNMVSGLPVKINKVKVRERFFNYFLIEDGQSVLMNKRAENDIWANMYDLPLIETKSLLTVKDLAESAEIGNLFSGPISILKVSAVHKHILTHQRLFVRLIKVKNLPLQLEASWFYVPVEKLTELALPKILTVLLEDLLRQ